VAAYLGDWLERRDAPASDLDLVVLLLNSLDLLADSDHQLTDAAMADRDAFLTRQLGLKG
jgi:hypothetical protein